MQTTPGFPTDLTVVEPTVAVTVNGVLQAVDTASVTRELPGSILASEGITAATCDMQWSQQDDLLAATPNPWGGEAFLPKAAEALTVDMGYGTALVRQLTGVLDASQGSITRGEISSSGVDLVDKLQKTVSFPPHMVVMPPSSENGNFLAVNNTPHFTTDRVLRACGFYATPKTRYATVLSAPLMGSAWPEIGTVTSASQTGFPTYPPSFIHTQWGVAPNSITAEWTPVISPAGSNMLNDKTFWMALKVRDKPMPSSGFTELSTWWGVKRIRLRVTEDRGITALSDTNTVYGNVVATMSAADADGADVFMLRVTPAGEFTIYASNGKTATGTLALATAMATTNITSVQLVSPHQTGPVVGGMQVGFYSYDVHLDPCTAVLSDPAETFGLDAVPAIESRVALDVLKEQAAAECAAMWLDEYGVFRWVNRYDLANAAPSATLTALDNLLDLQWEYSATQVRSGVQVNSRKPKIIRSPVSNVTLYVGSGESLQSGQVTTDLIKPPADQSWFQINQNSWTRDGLVRGEGTMLGGVVVKANTPDVWAQDVGKLSYTWEQVNTETVVLTHTAGNLGSGETVVLKTGENDTLLTPFRRDKPLPIIRGRAKVIWQDITTTGTATGPANASVLEHDARHWVQEGGLQTLANWIANEVVTAKPTLKDVPVVPDPRRQLADVVWLEAPSHMNVRLRVLITGITISTAPGEMQQTISGRVLEVVTTGSTNLQLDQLHANRTNAAFDTLWADATNAALDAAPLGRG